MAHKKTDTPGKLFIVSAPSGAGKTSLVTEVVRNLGNDYMLHRVITYTTKQPRAGEQHGKDYFFISEDEFKTKLEEGFFIEWSTSYGHYYGSPRSIIEVMAQGISLIAILDRTGAQAMRQVMPEAIYIWIYTKNIEILKQRLSQRNTETDEQVTKRLLLAQQEIQAEEQQGIFQHYILNDSFQSALRELEGLIIELL